MQATPSFAGRTHDPYKVTSFGARVAVVEEMDVAARRRGLTRSAYLVWLHTEEEARVRHGVTMKTNWAKLADGVQK